MHALSDRLLLNVAGTRVAVLNHSQHPLLLDFCSCHEHLSFDGQCDIEVFADAAGLHCVWHRPDQTVSRHFIEVDKFVKQQRSYPTAKQGALNQALGKKTKSIIDATGGWAGDAMLMCAQGYRVIMLERNPLMALLLGDAMQRLANTEWAAVNSVCVPKVINTNAIEYFSNEVIDVDCIYLDPMFPPKRKKSAASNKNMQLLHFLVGSDADAESLAVSAIATGSSRVVVKRPDYATPLHATPTLKFSSKLVHYDVYLRH